VDSQSAGKKAEIVRTHSRTSIAFTAGGLLTGKGIASLYGFTRLGNTEKDSLPEADCLQNAGSAHKGSVQESLDRYECCYLVEEDQSMDLSINGSTFVGRITGSSTHFIGNVRGNMMYVYDDVDCLALN
jgi:hypothetical protein